MQLYDVNEPSKFITYLGVNNFYGWAISQCLPYSRFKWLNQKETGEFDVNSVEENSPIG